MTINNSGTLKHLLAKEGADFVQACYREILHREPDEIGLADHLGALSSGRSKAQIAASIASSDEACLNNMATSRLAKAARHRAFLDGSALVWPLKNIVASYCMDKKAAKLEARRTALLTQVSTGAAPALVGIQQAVETVRVPESEWRTQIARDRTTRTTKSVDNLWFDLTTAFQWNGGVVGIVRAELEMASGLARIYPNVRFSMQIDQGFTEIPKDELRWLLDADNVTDAYMHFFARYKGAIEKGKSIKVQAPDVEGFYHPYGMQDAIIAVGWMDSQKERFFSIVRKDVQDIRIFYLVYDIILLLDETKHFYDPVGRERFERYVEWIAYNCDMIFYGGRTAQIDTEALQHAKGWPIPLGVPVKFGTDIVKKPNADGDAELLRKLGIIGDYIITVGSLEPRKNHETLYRAYLLALEMTNDDLPQLVFIGKPMWRVDDMIDTITRHPRLAGKLLCLTPTDIELAVLYKNCRFTLLPSLYEGWSLTLPESLGQGKFCLCSDTPPLREIGGELVDYVDTYDVRGWAEKIILYAKDDSRLHDYERRIAEGWPNMSWSDTSRMLLNATLSFTASQRPNRPTASPVVWMDLTMSFLEWQGGISGIVRAELEYAKQLKSLDPRTRFFAYERQYDYFFEVKDSYLEWLFNNNDLSESYESFHQYWNDHERDGTGHRNPFRQHDFNGQSYPAHPAYLSVIPMHSIIFFAGIDSDGTGVLSRVAKIDSLVRPNSAIMKSQTIYDLTPILTPHFHMPTTCIGFEALFKHVSGNFDHIVYGGRTAQADGVSVQQKEGWHVPASAFIEFGSDIGKPKAIPLPGADETILQALGIESDFAISVGTIEPRKNHEVLYKAYLTMLKKKLLDKPFQIVFVGNRGWKSGDFLASLEQDQRIQGKILIMRPTDEELDVLYRRCKFTLLPSFYEGWSLTLPESLSYGKLCLTSDVPPLRETGDDLVEYIHPLDTVRWAERIAHYANNPEALMISERRIADKWVARTWRESAEMLLEALHGAHRDMIADRQDAPIEGERIQ